MCSECRQPVAASDWACPHCGRILDRFLFSTVTAKSVAGGDKDAFQSGYDACMSQWKATGSAEVRTYKPVCGHETAYRAGWQHCAARLEAKAERKRGRRRGVVLLGMGAAITAAGAPMSVWSFQGKFELGEWPYRLLGLGILQLIFGVVAVITGTSDE